MDPVEDLGYSPGSVLLVAYIDWYDIRDRRRLEEALATLDGVEPIEKGEWVWHEVKGGGKRLLAEVGIEGEDTLAVVTKREEDATRCQSLLVTAAGDAIEFVIGEARHEHIGDSGTGGNPGSSKS